MDVPIPLHAYVSGYLFFKIKGATSISQCTETDGLGGRVDEADKVDGNFHTNGVSDIDPEVGGDRFRRVEIRGLVGR
jgi:hypothetical protein